MIPQIIYLIIVVMRIGVVLKEHGKPQTGDHDATPVFIGIATQILLLWWGGFFDILLK